MICLRRQKVPELQGKIFKCSELEEQYIFDFLRSPHLVKKTTVINFTDFQVDEQNRKFKGLIKWPETTQERIAETWFNFQFSEDYKSIEEAKRKNYDENQIEINSRWRLNSLTYQLIKADKRVKSFDVLLEECPLIGNVPMVLVLCCEEMERNIEKCVGVYRVAGIKDLKNETIKIMNSKIDTEAVKLKLKGVA
jgi:alpha-glucuronidase